MTDTLIAFLDPRVLPDADHLVEAALATWPDAVFTSSSGAVASTSIGRIELRDHGQVVLVDVLTDGDGVGVEGDDGLAATFIAWLTQQVTIPHEDAVVVTGWSPDVLSLRAGTTRETLLGLRG